MIRFRRIIAVSVAGLVLLTVGACSTPVKPNEVGLYYMKGSSDGYKFGHCMEPGASEDYTWDNEAIFLPADLRTWLISDTDGADDRAPIVVTAKKAEGQSSGTQVAVWAQTNLMLNTTCNGDKGGPLQVFWEKVGKRYDANNADGWKNMLRAVMVPALKKAINDNARAYTDAQLIDNANGERTAVQAAVATQFASELKKLTGGDFFCGPSFARGSDVCPPVEVIIIDVDYADPGIQAARNQKQKAIEEAAAAVAAAQGQLDAAGKLGELYKNPAWMKLEEAKLQLQMVQACASNPNCQIVFGADGYTVHTK